MERDPQLATFQRWNLAILAVAIVPVWLLAGSRAAWSLAIGGLLGAANFWLTGEVVRRVFVPDEETRRGAGAFLVLKYGALFGAVGCVLWLLRPEGVAFTAGFCSILAAVTASAVRDAIRTGRGADESGSTGDDGS